MLFVWNLEVLFMAMGGNVSVLLDMVRKMSKVEQRSLADQIMEMLASSPAGAKPACSVLVAESRSGRPDCPHCDAKAALGSVVKRGMCRGSQRYFCKSCGHYFVPTTNTAFERSRKDADTWCRFIELTISGASLQVCAQECRIAYQTAFNWRHKILHAFKVNQEKVRMAGRVEIDEMQIPVSYKGNHVKGRIGEKRERKHGEPNNLPRPSFHRGSDNRPSSPKNRACVFCMVEDGNKAFFAAVPGVGFMSEKMLDKTVGAHVNKETALVLADQYKVTHKYLERNQYRYMLLASNISRERGEHKPEIQGENRELHLQHVNAMHRHIRRFLRGYCGVSTKYLENYLSLFVWLKDNQSIKQIKRLQKVSVARAAVSDCYISQGNLRTLPAIPACA